METKSPTPSELIDLLGGTAEVARMFSIRRPSVTGWRKDGIPQDRLIKMAVVLHQRGCTPWNRFTLFPNDWWEIWPELRGQQSPASSSPEERPS